LFVPQSTYLTNPSYYQNLLTTQPLNAQFSSAGQTSINASGPWVTSGALTSSLLASGQTPMHILEQWLTGGVPISNGGLLDFILSTNGNANTTPSGGSGGVLTLTSSAPTGSGTTLTGGNQIPVNSTFNITLTGATNGNQVYNKAYFIPTSSFNAASYCSYISTLNNMAYNASPVTGSNGQTTISGSTFTVSGVFDSSLLGYHI